ncbi:hypothetical protein D3C85_995000 [compost metagenome]
MVKLPIKYPLVTSYTSSAALLSILSNSDDYLPWFISNYIQLYSDENVLDFYNFTGKYSYCPWIDSQIISRESFLKSFNNIHQFIQSNISEGIYVMIVVDRYYISNYQTFKQRHVPHPLFIYGYDSNKSVYLTGEFFRNGQYQYEEVHYNELFEAFMHCNDNGAWVKGISLYKYIPERYAYHFDLNFFRTNLSNYLNSICPAAGYQIEPVTYINFGIRAAECKLYEQIERIKLGRTIDIKVFAMLCNHKKVLSTSWDFLSQEGFVSDNSPIKEDLANLKSKYSIIQNFAIKYTITNNTDIHKKIDEIAAELLCFEKTVIGQFIEELKA